MTATLLSLTLEAAANEVLRHDVKLMDNRHDAPGYILFCTEKANEYIAYLVWTPSEGSPLPFCHAFQLTGQMDAAQIRQAVTDAQVRFLSDVERLRNLGGKRVVAIQGAEAAVQEWFGGSLDHYGKTPYGKARYRVVYAPTRLYLVGGRWHDRENGRVVRVVEEYRWIPRYQDTEGWVLEKWLSAEQYGGSRESWEANTDDDQECPRCRGTDRNCPNCEGKGVIYGTGLLPLGPYPEQGEYEACYTFPMHPPISMVEKIIQMIEYGKQNFRPRDIKQAHMEAILGRKAEHERRVSDMLRDALPAAWGRAISGHPERKTVDHNSDFEKTAEEIAKSMGDSAGDFRQVQ